MLNSVYNQKKRTAKSGGFDTAINVTTAATTGNLATVKVAGLQFVVQRLTVYVLTGSAGKTWTFGDSSGTVALSPALDMATAGVKYALDFGPKGRALTAGDALKVTISAAGAAADVQFEGYYVG